MNKKADDLGHLLLEAQRWERVTKQRDPTELAAFASWIRRSPAHLQAYLLNVALQTELEQLDRAGTFDLAKLMSEAKSNVVQLQTGVVNPSSSIHTNSGSVDGSRRYVTLAAGALLLTLFCLIRGSSTAESVEYTTSTGEQRRIALTDGSFIELNSQSHIRVSLAARSRDIDLLSGQAFFNVRHDASRPFRVHVGTTLIEDLGTQFSIYSRPGATTTVSVLEGQIQISSSTASRALPLSGGAEEVVPDLISTGEEADISATGKVSNHGSTDVRAAVAWREHRIWFKNATLQQVAAEFNRYNLRKISIGSDPELSAKRYTGTFDAYDPDSFIQALRDDEALSLTVNEQGVQIDSAQLPRP